MRGDKKNRWLGIINAMAAVLLIITRALENGTLIDLIIEGDGFEPPQVTLDLSDPDDTVRAVLAQVQTMGWRITREDVVKNTAAEQVIQYTLGRRS
jgi:hypothetical protein